MTSSPILEYKFDNADLTIDSSTSGLNLTNSGAVSFNDGERGLVASFDGSSKLTLPSGSVPVSLLGTNPRTYTMWINHQHTTDQGFFFSNGTDAPSTRIRLRIAFGLLRPDLSDNSNGGSIVIPSNEWHHIAVTYVGGTLLTYVDGVLDLTWPVTTNIGLDELVIGGESENLAFFFVGLISNVKIYDVVLSEAEITAEMNPASLDVTMYTHVADLTWDQVSGGNDYTLTFRKDSGTETTITTTSGLSHSIFNLTPESSYEFNIYSDLDPSTPVYTTTESSPAVNVVNVTSLVNRLGRNLTLLNSTSLDEIAEFLSSALTTGDKVETPLGTTTFIQNTGTFDVDNTYDAVLTAFDPSSGAGQNISVLLPDTSTAVISYDENTNQVTSGGTSYSVGDSFVLDTYKVTFEEF